MHGVTTNKVLGLEEILSNNRTHVSRFIGLPACGIESKENIKSEIREDYILPINNYYESESHFIIEYNNPNLFSGELNKGSINRICKFFKLLQNVSR